MKMPITKRIAPAAAIAMATVDEITSVKVKARCSKHRTGSPSHFRLTAVLSAILATSLFAPNAAMAANFNNQNGQGYLIDGTQYDIDMNPTGTTITSGTVYGWERSSGTYDASEADITIEGTSLSNVYGGYLANAASSSGNVGYKLVISNNKVTITDGSSVSTTVAGAYRNSGTATSSGTADISFTATGNEVYISDSSVASVYGAYTSNVNAYGTGDAYNIASENKVTITGGTVSNVIYGGLTGSTTVSGDYGSAFVSADSNEVYISGTTTTNTSTRNIYGGSTGSLTTSSSKVGITAEFSASSNIVSIDNVEKITGSVYGGDAIPSTSTLSNADSSLSIAANSNKVSITDNTTISGSVYGGYTNTVSVTGANSSLDITINSNEVSIEDSTVSGTVYGGNVSNSSATGTGSSASVTVNQNKVTLEGSEVGMVYGAHSQGTNIQADTSYNEVEITGSTVNGWVYGGSNGAGTATYNKVTITDSQVTASGVAAGNSGTGTTDGIVYKNEVIIEGSEITGTVYAGWNQGTGSTGDISENTVTIKASSSTGEGSTITGSVYGGNSSTNNSTNSSNVTKNTVEITDSTVESGTVAGGYTMGKGDATSNEVTITNGTVDGTGSVIYGGYAYNTNTTESTTSSNTVTINSGTISADIYGGYSGTGARLTEDNKVYLYGTEITGTVYGGYTGGTGAVTGNTITVDVDTEGNGTTIEGELYGGYSGSSSGNVESNIVTLNSGNITGDVYAGYKRGVGGEVTENAVTITSGVAVNGNVYGGYHLSRGDVVNNSITMDGGSVVGDLYAGYSTPSASTVEETKLSMTGNTIEVTGGTIKGSVYAAYGAEMEGDSSENLLTRDITNNTVTLENIEMTGNVYGGYNKATGKVANNAINFNGGEVTGDTFAAGYSSGSGDVSNNTIDINGGSLSGGYTYAGYSNGGTVSGNTINLNGGTVSGKLYAGFSDGGTAQNNVINLDGASADKLSDLDVTGAALYGSNIDVTGLNGNTLNIRNFSGRLENMGGFDVINIDMTGLDLATASYGSGSIIILTDSDSTGTNLNNSTVNVFSSTTYADLSVIYTSDSDLADAYTIVANETGNMSKDGATITEQLIVVQDPSKYSGDLKYSMYELITDPDDDGTISYGISDTPIPSPTPGPDPGPGPSPEPTPTDTNEGKTVAALSGIGNKLSMHYAQLSDLRRRLGEIRYGAQDGLWARYIYQRNSYDGVSSSSGAKQNMYGLNLGLDHIVSKDEEKLWLLGGNFQYGHDNEKVRSAKGKGNMNSYGLNLYATYANQYGCYADLVLTYDYYHQKIGAKLEDNSSTSGKFNTWGWGASIEVGKMFSFKQDKDDGGVWDNHWWLEPQAQLSYYWIKGKDWSMKNGMKVDQNNGDSLVGRLGVVAGKQWNYSGDTGVDKRYVQAYLKGGVKHEFLGNQKTKIDGVKYDHKLRGTSGYYGAGVDWNLTKQVKAYAQVERDAGGRYKRDIEASIGLKWQF